MSRYSEILQEHNQNPLNRGSLSSADAVGMANHHGQGPHLIVYLRLQDRIIREARFQSVGCGITTAVGSVLTETIRGRTVTECLRLTAADLIEILQGLPPTKHFCAEMGIIALRNALADWQDTGTT